MKFRIQLISFLFLAFILVFSIIEVKAGEVFDIVSGLNSQQEATFDTYRMISGEARQGARIVIRHYKAGDLGSRSLERVSIYDVGVSEIFTEIISLKVGTNQIEITGKIGEKTQTSSYSISRKDPKIKEKLDTVSNIFKDSENLSFSK